jgi:hypothetical protein
MARAGDVVSKKLHQDRHVAVHSTSKIHQRPAAVNG